MERFYKRRCFLGTGLRILLLTIFCAAVLTGCGKKKAETEDGKRPGIAETVEGEAQSGELSGRETDGIPGGPSTENGNGTKAEPRKEGTDGEGDSKEETPSDGMQETENGQETEKDRTQQETENPEDSRQQEGNGTESGEGETVPPANEKLVVIDAGHQQKGNSEKEPIGPGAEQTKAKVAGGTRGCVSGLAEYELTLAVALKLQEELEGRGYTVLQVRTSHDVNMSNAERAQTANDAGADAFIRIHANGSEDSSVNGAMTICQTPDNPYNGTFYEKSRKLSDCVLEGLTAQTGCKKQYVWETDSMSGINWCQVPVTIVEMGYMTNPDEDTLMASEEYQLKIAAGIADGIDRFWE